MRTTIDSAGLLVVPEVLRDRLGLTPGSTIDISPYGTGLQLVAVSRTARVRTIRGEVVAESETVITDEDVHDGLVGLAASAHDLALATRDLRAAATSGALGVEVVAILDDHG